MEKEWKSGEAIWHMKQAELNALDVAAMNKLNEIVDVARLRQRVAELERFHELDTKQIAYLFEERNNLTAERDELLAAKGKVSVTLTGKEIREIAELAGLQFVEHDYTDEYETEIAIESCPDKGIMNDDNAPEHYRLIAFLNEYPEEGCIGLGEKIEASAIARVKGGSA